MRLSELINQLQRLHDLYPQVDPHVLVTETAYSSWDIRKTTPEFFCREFNPTCFEIRTVVHLPSESLFSERGPYVNIFYEGDVIHSPEDFWKNNHFEQHENKQTGSVNSSSCTTASPEPAVDSTTDTKSTFELATEVLKKFNEDDEYSSK